MKTYTANYNGTTIQVLAKNERSAHYEARKIFTDAHWSEIRIYKNK